MPNSIASLAIALAITAASPLVAAAADGPGDPPVSDAMATQDPQAYSQFVTRACATPRSVNCYWDAIGHTGRTGWSYWSIRVGHDRCVRYWDAAYNRKHGHCEPIHAKHRRH